MLSIDLREFKNSSPWNFKLTLKIGDFVWDHTNKIIAFLINQSPNSARQMTLCWQVWNLGQQHLGTLFLKIVKGKLISERIFS